MRKASDNLRSFFILARYTFHYSTQNDGAYGLIAYLSHALNPIAQPNKR